MKTQNLFYPVQRAVIGGYDFQGGDFDRNLFG